MEEIEIRGKLSPPDFARLTKLLSNQGRLVSHYHRLSVDISPGFDPQTRTWNNVAQTDLRVKKSDRQEKLSVKIGDFHTKRRQEIEVALPEGQVTNALKLLAALGFDKGMVYFYQSWEYDYEGFSVKLTQYTPDYFSWEIESNDAALDPNILADELNLHPFTREEYRQEIDWQNQHLHQLYSLEEVEKILKANF